MLAATGAGSVDLMIAAISGILTLCATVVVGWFAYKGTQDTKQGGTLDVKIDMQTSIIERLEDSMQDHIKASSHGIAELNQRVTRIEKTLDGKRRWWW